MSAGAETRDLAPVVSHMAGFGSERRDPGGNGKDKGAHGDERSKVLQKVGHFSLLWKTQVRS